MVFHFYSSPQFFLSHFTGKVIPGKSTFHQNNHFKKQEYSYLSNTNKTLRKYEQFSVGKKKKKHISDSTSKQQWDEFSTQWSSYCAVKTLKLGLNKFMECGVLSRLIEGRFVSSNSGPSVVQHCYGYTHSTCISSSTAGYPLTATFS